MQQQKNHTNTHTHAYTHMNMCMHTHTPYISMQHIQRHTEFYVHAHTTHTHTHVHTHMHTQSHTHTHNFKSYLLCHRFVGPATSVKVHCTVPPRVEVRTVGEAVAELAQRLAYLVLTRQQLDLMQRSPPLVFLTGPPGTGIKITSSLTVGFHTDKLNVPANVCL